MIFDLVGKHFRALLNSSDIGSDFLKTGASMDNLPVLKTSLSVLHVLLWLSLPATLIFVFKRKKGFAVFEGAKNLGMYVLAFVASLAFLDLLMLIGTGTFTLTQTFRFLSALLSLLAFLGNLAHSRNPFQAAGTEEFVSGFRLIPEVFLAIQYGISLGFAIFSFMVYAAASSASVTGRKVRKYVFLLDWSMIFLVTLYSWHLVGACIVGSICMPVDDPSIDYNLSLSVNDVTTSITVQQSLTVVRSCAQGKSLNEALKAAATLKNAPISVGSLSIDPSYTPSSKETIIDCNELGRVGEAAIKEVCTGLLQTYDTMHSGVAVIFICSLTLLIMLLISFWYGKAENKEAGTGIAV